MQHETRVHCFRMKNVTLSADEDLIEKAEYLSPGRNAKLSIRSSVNGSFSSRH